MESIISILGLNSKPTRSSLRRHVPSLSLALTPFYFITKKDISIEMCYLDTF